MRIYLASRYSRHPEMRVVASELEGALGCSVTSRWIYQHDGQIKESFTPDRLSLEPTLCGAFATVDVEDLRRADAVISFTGSGGKGGRHVEFGLAAALGKRLLVVGPRENVFHCLPEVEHFETWAACFSRLANERFAVEGSAA